MRQYVTDYVQSCEICEEQKNPQRKKRSLVKTYVSGVKFERIAMDIAGPFPRSENEYVYILVVADYFTKFTEIYPLPNIEAARTTPYHPRSDGLIERLNKTIN